MDAPALAKLIGSPPLESAPAPSRLAVLRHAAWRDAQRKVDELGRHAREAKVFVFPIWYGTGGAWQPVFPADGVADSPEERFEITLANEADAARMVVRAVDWLQNATSVTVAVK